MNKFLLITTVLLLAACSHNTSSTNNNNGTNTDADVPTQLSAHTITVKAALSAQDTTLIQADMASFSNYPDLTLAFPNSNPSGGDPTQGLNAIAKQTLTQVQTDCTITPANDVVTGSDVEPGSSETDDSTATINGQNCPVNYTDTEHMVTLDVRSNIDSLKQNQGSINNLDALYHGTSTSQISSQVVSTSLQQTTGVLGVTTSSNATSVVHVIGQNSDFYVKGTATINVQLANGQKPQVQAIVEMLQKSNTSLTYYEMDFNFGTVQPTVQIWTAQDGTQKIYLNGQATTASALEAIFGSNIVPSSQARVRSALKIH